MSAVPEIRYAETSDGSVAYQAFGGGAQRVVLVPDWHNPVELLWEDPRAERFFTDLAAFARVILFDKRGTGVSDPIPFGATMSAGPTTELAAEDIAAVMDAEGWREACILGIGVGCWSAALFAATAPTRVTRLVLVDAFPRLQTGPDFPDGLSREVATRTVQRIASEHGTGSILRLTDPAAYADLQFRRWYARAQRFAMPRKWMKMFWSSVTDFDISSVLSSITAPTLVMNRCQSIAFPVAWGRHVARRIAGAEFRELPGRDELFFMTNPSRILEELRQFLTGVREAPVIDRILATILFTDIAGSTERLAALGDRPWRDRMLRHNSLVRRELARFRGVEIDSAGDGFLASFDGPARAIQCAVAIRESVQQLDLQVRAGIHVGECELVGEKIGGIAVHIASRVTRVANAGEILVTRTVQELVAGSGLRFQDRGSHTLKGVPEPWQLYALQNPPIG
ncbi:MAG TPA: alpha/beta fold hydrolase [Myxococcota bacterium]|nr:alpha/beta fold hydrolase [Myxococcota bacterium]